MRTNPDGARIEHLPRPTLVAGSAVIEAEFAADRWHADRLGAPARRGRRLAQFGTISQLWLREPVKAWSRFRLATGLAFTTISAGALALSRFSKFLAECHPDVVDGTGITRAVLEHYLSWLASSSWSTNTRLLSLSMLRGFLDACRRHGWLAGLSPDAVIYEEELPRREERIAPRFVAEFVMAQLESEAHLALLPSAMDRSMVTVLIETGIRIGDLCELPFNPIVTDSSGWPCLRFRNAKVHADQLIPLSAKAAEAIRDQQERDRNAFPNGTPWLFPAAVDNDDGTLPCAYSTFSQRLRRWERRIDLHDEAGLPARVTAHQFRHTLGTRLINHGVPQHIVQKLLGHASPEMVSVYAHIHDSTVRREFECYQRQRVNTSGELVTFDAEAPTATAEWVKHNLGRIADSLPNGYCGRPPQQNCPHPNACLTCPDFQTTPEFLDVHRRHAEENRQLIARADANGQFRLATNLQQVQDSLDRIIPALEALPMPSDGGE